MEPLGESGLRQTGQSIPSPFGQIVAEGGPTDHGLPPPAREKGGRAGWVDPNGGDQARRSAGRIVNAGNVGGVQFCPPGPGSRGELYHTRQANFTGHNRGEGGRRWAGGRSDRDETEVEETAAAEADLHPLQEAAMSQLPEYQVQDSQESSDAGRGGLEGHGMPRLRR